MWFFRYLWGQDGDRSAVPQETQPDGTLSFQQGFGPDYARDQTSDPLAKDIPRLSMNQILYNLSESARQFQTFGAFPFITAAQNGGVAFPYDKNARALWTDGEIYVSLINGNTDPDPSASVNWVLWVANPAPPSTVFPVGMVQHVFDTVAPAGWVIRNGLTIGNAASGATNRANADTELLFTRIWNTTANAGDFIIQDNGGSPTVRGVSAALDFAAGKRMPLPNDPDFDRGTPAGAVLGTRYPDTIKSHEHSLQLVGTTVGGVGNVSVDRRDNNGNGSVTMTASNKALAQAGGAAETAPKHRCYLPIISLGV